MIFIVLNYILWISPAHGGPVGFGLDLNLAYVIAATISIAIAVIIWKRGRK